MTLFKHSKQTYYILVCLIAGVSVYLLLINLRSDNRKFNQNLLTNSFNLYSNYMENLNKENNFEKIVGQLEKYGADTNDKLSKPILPFKLSISSGDKNLKYVNEENTLYYNLDNIGSIQIKSLTKIINKFSIYSKDKSGSMIISDIKIPLYNHITLYFLVHEEQDLTEYNKYFNQLRNLSEKFKLNIYIKFLFYDKFNGVESPEDFYKDLKYYNSKSTFDELINEESINLLIYDNKKIEINTYYNKDINNDIYSFNFEDNFNENFLTNLINVKLLDIDLKLFMKSNLPIGIISEFIEINNSDSFYFHRLLAKSFDHLFKINKIFSLYESIRTIEYVKDRFTRIQNTLIHLTKSNFKMTKENIDLVTEMFIDTKYLIESNELVSVEHYFSNEFKIGMFLPVFLPVLYGFVKAIKALRK